LFAVRVQSLKIACAPTHSGVTRVRARLRGTGVLPAPVRAMVRRLLAGLSARLDTDVRWLCKSVSRSSA
jgi:hypothetical protein